MKNLIILGKNTAPFEIQKIHDYNITDREFYHIASIFDSYAEKGAIAIKSILSQPYEGNPVIHHFNWPAKSKGNLLDFALSAHSYYKNQELRGFVEITYITPQEKVTANDNIDQALYYLLERMHIEIITDYCIAKIDPVEKSIVDLKGRKVNFDLLVTLPEANKKIRTIKEFETQFDHKYCSRNPNQPEENSSSLIPWNADDKKSLISETTKRINKKHPSLKPKYELNGP